MGYARKDVEKTKKIAKKFVRYQEGAELYSIGLTKFQELAKEAKAVYKIDKVLLPNFSAHNLRHTFCTRLCERETNLKVIQSIMGHKDIQTTMDIYAEATEEKKQETFEHLAATMDVF
ncbi:DUF6462 family protein [Mediterraneibacter gnavus]|uniref:DUF6462 family protein n=1 Tax=Mediterraneibacter gnavus TaxID=33038 RepID=UPI0032C0490F